MSPGHLLYSEYSLFSFQFSVLSLQFSIPVKTASNRVLEAGN
jgi:hypothetical protein